MADSYHGRCFGYGVQAALALWGITACGPSSESVAVKELALTAEQNVEQALRGAHRAGGFIADSEALADALSAGSQSCEPVACPAGSVCPEPECSAAVTVADLQGQREDMSSGIDDLVQSLRDDIFTDENLESSDDSSVTYLLGPDLFCSSEDVVAVPPGGVPPESASVDPDCADSVERLEPRLRLSSPSAGNVDVQLLLTAGHHNPVTLQLYQDRVGVVVDLAGVKSTLDEVGEAIEGLASMSGRLGFEILKNAELDYSLRFNVLDDLSVVADGDDGQSISYSLGASVPTAELRFDGNTRRVVGSYAMGTLMLQGPLQAFRGSFEDTQYDDLGNPLPGGTYTGMIDLLIGGLDGSVVFDGNTDRLSFEGLGLGDVSSTLKHDGVTLAQLDLNPDAGRHFDVTVENVPDTGTQVTLSPTFDLNAMLNFAPLADQVSDIPSYMLSDTLRIWFDGDDPSFQSEQDQLRVLSGALHLSSAAVPEANLDVPAGSCLFDSGAEAPAHELLGTLAAGACR